MPERIAAAAAVAALLAVPAAAHAHVTLQPKEAPAGSYARLDVRVPNERDDAGTTKVVVQMPDGVTSAQYEAAPGWRIEVRHEKLAEPIDAGHGETSSTQVDQVVITGDGKTGIIAPGQFRDFGLSLRVPDGKPGDKLVFKALQTYEDGEVVRWIGAEDSDKPAAMVTLTAPAGHAATTAAAATEATPEEGGDGDTLGIVALAVGALGLLAGGAALMTSRRRVAA